MKLRLRFNSKSWLFYSSISRLLRSRRKMIGFLSSTNTSLIKSLTSRKNSAEWNHSLTWLSSAASNLPSAHLSSQQCNRTTKRPMKHFRGDKCNRKAIQRLIMKSVPSKWGTIMRPLSKAAVARVVSHREPSSMMVLWLQVQPCPELPSMVLSYHRNPRSKRV